MVRIACEQGLNTSDIACFKNKGYLGLYNMGLQKLKDYKRFSPSSKRDTLYDYMGKTELAINNFRTLLTGEKINKNNITNTNQMYKTAKDMGAEVRNLVVKSIGEPPESLKLEKEKINQIKTKTKQITKEID